jgi:hypothetical protein
MMKPAIYMHYGHSCGCVLASCIWMVLLVWTGVELCVVFRNLLVCDSDDVIAVWLYIYKAGPMA